MGDQVSGMSALVTVLILLQVADVGTTLWVLRRQGGREANRWLAWLMDGIGEVPALLLVKGALIAAVAAWHGQTPTWLLAALVALYLAVIANNARVIARGP